MTENTMSRTSNSTANYSFGVVSVPTAGGRAWLDQVQAAEQQGWTSLLVPDTLWTPSVFPTLAAAAAVTSNLRLRSWVLAAPLRSPAAVVREVSALQVLSGGRFELGIGTGRPDAEREADLLGVPWGTPAERIGQVLDVVAAVREKVTPAPTVAVTASGPRMLATAARIADRIGLALPPTAGENDLRAAVDRVRSSRQGPIGLTLQLSGIAGKLPTWLARIGLDPAAMTQSGAIGMLTGDAGAMTDTLQRWRSEFGIDEILVPGELADEFAPVISRMTG
jgi:alkanesulfonate monooxygenase SsuD/methylene tetrahydromethanopterin reductase-like flavin-dependent oxidoreductase (luciferase family)